MPPEPFPKRTEQRERNDKHPLLFSVFMKEGMPEVVYDLRKDIEDLLRIADEQGLNVVQKARLQMRHISVRFIEAWWRDVGPRLEELHHELKHPRLLSFACGIDEIYQHVFKIFRTRLHHLITQAGKRGFIDLDPEDFTAFQHSMDRYIGKVTDPYFILKAGVVTALETQLGLMEVVFAKAEELSIELSDEQAVRFLMSSGAYEISNLLAVGTSRQLRFLNQVSAEKRELFDKITRSRFDPRHFELLRDRIGNYSLQLTPQFMRKLEESRMHDEYTPPFTRCPAIYAKGERSNVTRELWEALLPLVLKAKEKAPARGL